jgi:hypothetical protein|nr:MAG TPA: capsid protein [Caudoviricetes sp.]
MDFQKYFTSDALAEYWTNDVTNAQAFGSDALFPPRKKSGLELKWIRGHKGVGISLMPSAFDTKATFRERKGFKMSETEMPFFREGFHIDEKDRQMLMEIQNSKSTFAEEIISRIFDDAAELITGARIVPERMAWQLLCPENGKPGITIKANGVNYIYDYDPDGTWQAKNYKALTGKAKWDVTTSTPLTDFATAKDAIAANVGETITRAYMNTNTLNKMIASDEVKNRFMTVTAKSIAVLTQSEARALIEQTTDIKIHLFDKMYQPEGGGDSVKYIPDGYVVLVPDGKVGEMWYGTTPEEADLRAGMTNASVSIVNNGVAVTTIKEPHPVNTNIIASEIVLPSFQKMDAVYCIKAY